MKLMIPLLLVIFSLSFADEAGLGLVTGIDGSTIISYGNLRTNFEGTRLVFFGSDNLEIPQTRLQFPFTATVVENLPIAKKLGPTTFIRIIKFFKMEDGVLRERDIY